MGASASSPSASDARAGAAYWSVGVPIASPVTSPRTVKRESDYFYTLVFANTKSVDTEDDYDRHSHERVSYADALATLRAVTGGGREREARVIDEFRAAWVAKFRTPDPAPHDSVPWRYFQELMRELIVQRFDAIPDLFLKTALSDDGKMLLISFRPSRALLCATADKLQLKVAMMAEVDPGARYWASDATRAIAEAYQWTKADAQEELVRLFLAGKISSQETQIFEDEDPSMWSRRLHALRRFVDPDVAKIVAEQEATAEGPMTTFLPFKNRASLRYLYRQIDGAAGEQDAATPFRVVDKIRLTKAIIDAEFDCDALVDKRLLAHHCCTHSHHTDAVDTSIDVLRAQWGALSSPWRLFRQGRVRLLDLPHWQPLVHVRNYFGEELALYFAYTSFYAKALQWLCVAALAATALPLALTLSSREISYYYHDVAFAVVSTAFIQAFVRKWAIEEKVLAMQWGVTTLRDADVARPQFRGQLAVSAITHRLETHYSPQRRQLQQIASTVILLGLSVGMLSVDLLALTSDWYTNAVVSRPVVVHVAVAAVAKVLSGPCAALCVALTEWENHRTQHDHDASLTLKFAVVQSVNLFGVLWLQTFVLPFLIDPNRARDCLDRAAHLLSTFLCVELAVATWDLRLAFVRGVLSALPSWRRGSAGTTTSTSSDSDRMRLLPASALAEELALDPYEGVMFDYAQVVITFGWVAWFAALAPLATLLAWGVAVLQIRVDAFKLCALTQRPFPAQKNSIGGWGVFLHVLAFGAWLHNAMLTVLYMAIATPSGLQDLKGFLLLYETGEDGGEDVQRLATETRLIVAFAGFCCLAGLARIHDQRDRALLKQLRWRRVKQRFLEDKYLHNLDRVPDAVWEALPKGRVFLNGVHQYVVTGNKAEEDAAEEILDELVQLQRRGVQLQRQIAEMRASDASVGLLVVEVGSINILPVMDALTKAVDSFLQLQLTPGEGEDAELKAKKAKPVNTSVIKKQRSPAWSESFELALRSLDDALLVRVYDWELLGKNRRIGHATLRVADVVATAPPLLLARESLATAETAVGSSPRALSVASDASTVASHAVQRRASSSPTHAPKVRMASFEVAIEMPDVLLSAMHADLVRHGHPKLSLRCGVQLDALGRLLLHQRELQAKIGQLQEQEKQFFEWKE